MSKVQTWLVLRHIASVAAERDFSLTTIICTRVKNSFTVDHISDLTTEDYWEKELVDRDQFCVLKYDWTATIGSVQETWTKSV